LLNDELIIIIMVKNQIMIKNIILKNDKPKKYKIIEHKDKQYILQDNKVYCIDDDTLEKLFCSYTKW